MNRHYVCRTCRTVETREKRCDQTRKISLQNTKTNRNKKYYMRIQFVVVKRELHVCHYYNRYEI